MVYYTPAEAGRGSYSPARTPASAMRCAQVPGYGMWAGTEKKVDRTAANSGTTGDPPRPFPLLHPPKWAALLSSIPTRNFGNLRSCLGPASSTRIIRLPGDPRFSVGLREPVVLAVQEMASCHLGRGAALTEYRSSCGSSGGHPPTAIGLGGYPRKNSGRGLCSLSCLGGGGGRQISPSRNSCKSEVLSFKKAKETVRKTTPDV